MSPIATGSHVGKSIDRRVGEWPLADGWADGQTETDRQTDR